MTEQGFFFFEGGGLKTFQSSESQGLNEEGHSNLPACVYGPKIYLIQTPSEARLWAFQ